MSFENAIAAIEQRAAASIKTEAGDYEKDGLLHCGKCHTPKQCCVELFGAIRKPPCLCKCAVEAREREAEARRQHEFAMQVQRYRSVGFPESEMANWNFAADDGSNPKMITAMQNYVEHFPEFRKQGKGLLLFGTVCLVLSAPIWIGYIVGFVFSWDAAFWFATIIWGFWLLPGAPFFAVAIAITLGIKKLFRALRKRHAPQNANTEQTPEPDSKTEK